VILVVCAGDRLAIEAAESLGIDAPTIMEHHNCECLVIEATESALDIVPTTRRLAANLILRVLADGLSPAEIVPPPAEVQQAVLHGLH
jgi:alkanesulfonate monooxygenase SsuD/methylene tetrahydromethanopterin reductase-like flavin-dependent oxidoreductase (luciferase family)